MFLDAKLKTSNNSPYSQFPLIIYIELMQFFFVTIFFPWRMPEVY